MKALPPCADVREKPGTSRSRGGWSRRTCVPRQSQRNIRRPASLWNASPQLHGGAPGSFNHFREPPACPPQHQLNDLQVSPPAHPSADRCATKVPVFDARQQQRSAPSVALICRDHGGSKQRAPHWRGPDHSHRRGGGNGNGRANQRLSRQPDASAWLQHLAQTT